MERYLFIVRTSDDEALIHHESVLGETPNLFALAHDLMFSADTLAGDDVSARCEIWVRNGSQMSLLVTVY